MKINVLQLINSFHQGGSERQAVQLCRLLKKDGNFGIFAACLDGEGSLRSEFDSLDLGETPEYKLNNFYNANFFRQVKQCANFIKSNEIKIVHTHDFYTNIFGIAAAFYARVSVRIASKRETSFRSGKQNLIERQAFRLSGKIVANSEAVKEYLVSTGVPGQKIEVLYNGLDLERISPSNDLNPERFRAEFGLPVDKSYQLVSIVANLRSDVKNPKMFLRAAKHVSDKVENIGFVLAGEGELIKDLKRLATELGVNKNTFFIGKCLKVNDLLAVSNVCVLSSRSEGFSNSILEYMAAAKPVVATNVGGAAEAILENVTGFLVESDDDSALANNLIKLLNDPKLAQEMGAQGRIRVENNFSLAAQLKNTLTLYENQLQK